MTLRLRADHSQDHEPNPNRLVELGIVPEDLADVLLPPSVVPKRNNRKINGARLITSMEVDVPAEAEVRARVHVDEDVYPDDGICCICNLNTRAEWVGCDFCHRCHYIRRPQMGPPQYDYY